MNNKNVSASDFTFGKSQINDIKKAFDVYGVVIIKDAIDQTFSNDLLESSHSLALDLTKKLGFPLASKKSNLDKLDFYIKDLEEKDRPASVQLQGLIAKSLSITKFSLNPIIHDFVSKLLDLDKKRIILESHGSFVPNIPSNKSRLYTYHSEEHWLPYRKKFLNGWAPLFRRKEQGNGTMHVKPYSHLKKHEFYEYRGYSDNYDKSFYMQYEVPEDNNYKNIALEADPSDLVFFHQNILHTSEQNQTDEIGYLWVNRFFDVSLDYTISSVMGIRPYTEASEEVGRKIFIDNSLKRME